MSQRYFFAFWLALASYSIGCARFNDPLSDDSIETTKITSLEVKSRIQYSVTPLEEPEKYLVRFSWPNIEEGKLVRVRQGSFVNELKSSQNYFTHKVDHNQVVSYGFDILDKNKNVEDSFSLFIRIPIDLVIKENNSDIKIDKNNKSGALFYNRLFLSQNQSYKTNGQNVDLTINELHSNGGVIETFSENKIAEEGKPGQSGGFLNLKINKLFGKLTIILRGENGSNGKDGESLERAQRGNPAEKVEPQCADDYPGKGLFAPKCSCPKFGRNASNGFPGIKGLPGKNGYDGGNTGSVNISVTNFISDIPKDEKPEPIDVVNVIKIPGRGGEGGKPGPGQIGGLGGIGRDPNNWGCDGLQGSDGQNGPEGDPGKNGYDGDVGKTCIHVDSENIHACEN